MNPTINPKQQSLFGISEFVKQLFSTRSKNSKDTSLNSTVTRERAFSSEDYSLIKIMKTHIYRSPYYCNGSGATNIHRRELLHRFLKLREEILKELVKNNILNHISDAEPIKKYRTQDYKKNKEIRQKIVDITNNTKRSLGKLYENLKVSPEFPFGMPLHDASYNEIKFVENGQLGIDRKDKSCDYTPRKYQHITEYSFSDNEFLI